MPELSNPLLQQAETTIENNLTPENRANYQKIVVAGMRAGLEKGPDSILASLMQSKDPVSDAAKGAVSLVFILRREAHGVMPMKALVPAATTLMIKALDFCDRAKIIAIGNKELVRATHILTDAIFARVGITKQGLANAAQKIQALTENPAAVEAIKMKAGLVARPGAQVMAPVSSQQAGRRSLINGGGI